MDLTVTTGDADKSRVNKRLSARAAREIRERFASGESVYDLASDYGVSDQAIKDVLNFETWVGAGGPRREGKL
jgi:hypothetical protein